MLVYKGFVLYFKCMMLVSLAIRICYKWPDLFPLTSSKFRSVTTSKVLTEP